MTQPRGGARRAAQLAAVLSIAGCLLGAGCQAGVHTVPVSGRIELDGQPLAGATVTFQPVAGADKSIARAVGSVGQTGADGKYDLRLIAPDQPGAVPGTHVITITTARAGSSDSELPQGERVPKVWRNGSQTFVVPPEGTSSADFDVGKTPDG